MVPYFIMVNFNRLQSQLTWVGGEIVSLAREN